MLKVKNIAEEDKNYFQQFYSKHNVVGLLEEEPETRIIVKLLK